MSFFRLFHSTGGRAIVESSCRDRLWGAVKEGLLRGENVQERLRSELRAEAMQWREEKTGGAFFRVPEPAISNFLLLGHP